MRIFDADDKKSKAAMESSGKIFQQHRCKNLIETAVSGYKKWQNASKEWDLVFRALESPELDPLQDVRRIEALIDG